MGGSASKVTSAFNPKTGLSSAAGIIGDLTGAGAAGQAAQAQEAAANAQLKYIKQQSSDALAGLNTPQALAEYQKSLGSEEKSVQRQESLAQALGQQAQSLLSGNGNSAVLDPFKNQRQTQRQQLLDQLREQLGAGAETSTVGQQALRRFDSDTSTQLSGLQQSSLGQILGASQSQEQLLGGANQGLANLGFQPGLQSAQVRSAFIPGVNQAFQNKIQSAGSQYAGEVAQGSAISGLLGSAAGAAAGRR